MRLAHIEAECDTFAVPASPLQRTLKNEESLQRGEDASRRRAMSRRQRILSASGRLVLVAAALISAGTAIRAQEEIPGCPPVQVGQELRELPSLSALNG